MKSNEQDLLILKFETYDEYLDSLVDGKSLQYFGDRENLISLFRTGYRALTKDAFEAQKNFLQVAKDPNTVFSRNIVPKNEFLQELASRERPNRLGLLSTIIYIRSMSKNVEISGYIDYEEALRRVHKDQLYSNDWNAIFAGEAILRPTPVDLLYYNAKTGNSLRNNSRNYRILCDPLRGILFRNMYDRKDVIPDPMSNYYGTNTSRLVVSSEVYEQVALYDHVVRINY
ncbi:cilia- and flagella-associated protein 299-like [Anopheles bellator]|uniref:cilia- and flagella-associated protein 299-like n=1 Tax=Anopheles bellator TaxID=139047 RepID=UPI002647A3C7|nr:cilia- and flagella-associated protein 299-like [Anopheles bellator]